MSSLPFDESDYRSVLRKWVAEQPNRGRGELKTMAEKLGVPSPVFSQILSGSRELSEDHAYLLSDHMGFNDLQREYFIGLVQFARASHAGYQNHLKSKLLQIRNKAFEITSRPKPESTLSDADLAEYYSTWIYSAIRTLAKLKSRGINLEDICREFHLDRDRAIRTVQFLLRVRALEIKNSYYVVGPAVLNIKPESSFFHKNHVSWRLRAIEKAHSLRSQDLMNSTVLALSEKDFFELREKMQNLLQEVVNSKSSDDPEKMVCFNLDFFDVR